MDGLSDSERPSLTPPAVWIRRNRRLFGDYGFQPEPGYARTVRHATDDSGLTLLTLRRFASARGRRSPAGGPVPRGWGPDPRFWVGRDGIEPPTLRFSVVGRGMQQGAAPTMVLVR